MQTFHLGTESLDPDEMIRRAWGESLSEHMASYYDASTETVGMTRKQLKARLDALGLDVSLQSIGLWLSGKTSPRPSVQILIGKALGVPPRALFRLEAAA